MSSALVIGQVTMDEYYNPEGELIAKSPGGTAINSGLWLKSLGFDTSVTAVLGEDFPELQSLDMSMTREREAKCPVSEIYLSENGEENVVHEKGDYELMELNGSGKFDAVYLTSGFGEYISPFLNSDASIKAFSPGPEPEELDMKDVDRCLEEADVVLMNQRERELLEERRTQPVSEIPEESDVHYVIVTDADHVVSYGERAKEYPVSRDPNPVDTIGAGDAFSSGYIAATINGADHDSAVEKGIECSKQIIKQKGAMPQNPIRV